MVLISSGSNAVLAARNRPKVLKYPVTKAEMMKMMAAVVSSLLVLLVRLQGYWLLTDEMRKKMAERWIISLLFAIFAQRSLLTVLYDTN